MFVLIRLNKRRAAHKAVGRDKAWLGLAAEDDITVMESPQPLVDHPLACDAVLTTLLPQRSHNNSKSNNFGGCYLEMYFV